MDLRKRIITILCDIIIFFQTILKERTVSKDMYVQ